MEISRGEGKRSLRYKKEDEEVGSEVGLREEEEEDDDDDGRKKRVISTGTDLHSKRWSKGGGSSSSCQVDGCDSDLSAAKPYHRRHKVCEYHAKDSSVLISGMHQRFCQQCSRFHEVSEFDESKRSCRRRLAGHNERRRKIASD